MAHLTLTSPSRPALRPRRPLVSLLAAAVVGTGLTVLPVVTPAWAQPHAVKPAVHTVPLAGVDAAALAAAPPAFDPAAAEAADAAATSAATLAGATAGSAAGTAAGAAALARAAAAPVPAPTKRVARADRPAVFTGGLDTGRFTAAGVQWSSAAGDPGVVVQVRLKENGRWSDWQTLDREGGPDAGTAEARSAAAVESTSPIVSPDATGIQVRVDTKDGTAPAGLRLMTVDPGTSAADATLSGAPAASASAATTQPGIYSRAQWGADESLLQLHAPCPGYVPTIKVGFVHHTVSTNSYSPDQVAGLIRGIYAYHVQGNGWCDIGYNFLVDKFGRIFEGRHGGIGRDVQGAHTLAFNWNSFGVAAIGDYTSAAPSSAMLGGISSVLGWKLGLHGRNPAGRDTLVSAGGPGAKWPAGTAVSFPVVSGHRDAYATSCPGNALYGQLQTLRNQAASYAASRTSRSQDLYGVLTAGTGSGQVELHAQSGSSKFASRMLDVATSLKITNPQDWRFFIGSNMGDTRPDLIAVHFRNTDSGRVDVHVSSWASGWTDTTVNTITPSGELDDDWSVSVGGPSGGDVYLTRLRGSGTGKVEVHVLSAASDYTQWSLHAATVFPALPRAQVADAFAARGTGDLYVVLRSATGSGRTELHALRAAGGYTSWIIHTATPLGPTPDRSSAQWAIGTATTPDLLYLPTAGTGSGRVEAHLLLPAAKWTAWGLHMATSLPAGQFPAWQLSLG